MAQTHSPRRSPWIVASFVTPIVFVIIYLLGVEVVSASNPSALSALLYSILTDFVLALVALFVGYTFIRRFKYPLRGVFLTCMVSSFILILAISLAMVVPEASNAKVVTNLALFLFGVVASSAFEGVIVAALVSAGAMIGGRRIVWSV